MASPLSTGEVWKRCLQYYTIIAQTQFKHTNAYSGEYGYLHYSERLAAPSIQQKIVLRNQDDSELDHPCQQLLYCNLPEYPRTRFDNALNIEDRTIIET